MASTLPRKPLSYDSAQPGRRTNTTKNARSGQRYRVKRDQEGDYYHVYSRGKKAKRVKLSKTMAGAYGYTRPGNWAGPWPPLPSKQI